MQRNLLIVYFNLKPLYPAFSREIIESVCVCKHNVSFASSRTNLLSNIKNGAKTEENLVNFLVSIDVNCDALDRFSLETGPPLQLEYANKGGEETISLTISTDFDSVAGPSPDFSRHTLVRPRVYHGRTRRQISSTKENVSTILFSRKEILLYSRQHIRAPL